MLIFLALHPVNVIEIKAHYKAMRAFITMPYMNSSLPVMLKITVCKVHERKSPDCNTETVPHTHPTTVGLKTIRALYV